MYAVTGMLVSRVFQHLGVMSHLLLKPGDVAVKVDAVLPGAKGILSDPLGQPPDGVLLMLGLQISFQQQLSMENPLKVLCSAQSSFLCMKCCMWTARLIHLNEVKGEGNGCS